ncbi:hypothetical protein PFICI_04880 [Pestalotiopsis fici W106-1]|uniref:Heterokaryon incompatibility domain-containing protein n=1 Tax=Pestalotiopsis fici (strain W106-1 / CGMCC3.15140) TaxID=1229662 RepID=W3XAE7_PESFW|nr:uncharacterized protein PFICI_04880 [Pestalotiopsis fici W106-1]ETS83004.1 hypothetical protein PFICI_04880 [Pestalotiopsis fici W106-1]
MEHIAAHHGEAIATDIGIPCMDDFKSRNGRIKLPRSFAEFYAFPEKHGWTVDPNTFELRAETAEHSLEVLLQAWLFFGLIFTVVKYDGKPILDVPDLFIDDLLSTKSLADALKKWSTWESRKENRAGLRLRMIQAGCVLDHARQVLRKNCALINEKVLYVVDDPRDKCYMTDEHVLMLMCLGEALSEVKSSIMKDNEVKIEGWQPDDDQHGWGPARYTSIKMKDENWCPRTIKLLRGQFSSNATMLLSAYYAYRTNGERTTPEHGSCTPIECKVKSQNSQGEYRNRHICKPLQTPKCESMGPEQDAILSTLESDRIPLIQFRSRTDVQQGFEVIDYDRKAEAQLEFVAISHVWSDGWGNENVNQLNICQLEFIRRQITRVSGSAVTPFWMDTLVVPVCPPGNVDEFERIMLAKKKAIQQILAVFGESKWTIVIDNGLFAVGAGLKTAEPAMKVLSSVWMRRLWTLQEAYLSRKIHFVFKERSENATPIRELEDIEKKLTVAMVEPASGLAGIVRDQLSDIMLLDKQRDKVKVPRDDFKIRNRSNLSTEEASLFIANVWRAARWRSTTRPEHETLALATILELDTENTEIAEAGLLGPQDGPSDKHKQQKLVEIFWAKVHLKHPGAIPSGLIFLPGEKINTAGYGWAPTTLLSADEIDYPDPMNIWNTRTQLGPKGLLVSYPGFILHTDSDTTRSAILSTRAVSNDEGNEVVFTFPIDRTLNEWYSFTKADNRKCPELTRLVKDSHNLAIILSRHPRELPREIALLVEVSGQNLSSDGDSSIDAPDYHVKIIQRIYIWRSASIDRKTELKQLRENDYRPSFKKDFPIAEMLGPRQRWWVDGYVRPSIAEEPLPTRENKRPTTGPKKQSGWRPNSGVLDAIGGKGSFFPIPMIKRMTWVKGNN